MQFLNVSQINWNLKQMNGTLYSNLHNFEEFRVRRILSSSNDRLIPIISINGNDQ